MAQKRINLNLDEELVAKIDEYAKKNYVNRTNAFAMIASTFFRQEEAMELMKQTLALEKLKSM